MALNQDQSNAVEQIKEFLLHPTINEVGLAGRPGRGKTYLISYLLREILPEIMSETRLQTVAVTAMTNRAAGVIAGMGSVGPITTIHSFLKLGLTTSYHTGKKILHKTKRSKPVYNALIIIDESSMTNEREREIINELCVDCKIIYVGDKNQLLPVGSKNSPIFDSDIPIIELKEPMRFQGPLADLSDSLGDAVENNMEVSITPNGKEIQILSDEDAIALIADRFSEENYVRDSVRILCFTNDQTTMYNDHIRQELLGLPEHLTIGEYVELNQPVTSFGESQLLKTDATYKVTDIGETFDFYDVPCMEVFLDNTDSTIIPVDKKYLAAHMKKLAKQKDWKAYYQFADTVADLRPAFSSTVHKAQGGTYDEVIIDIGDIQSCLNIGPYKEANDMFRRLLNVACSRARKTVYFINAESE